MADDPVDLGIPGIQDAVEIGRGGFAAVYKAFQPTFRRSVAVKVVAVASVDPETKARFERECQSMGLLSGHPNIVTIHDAGFTKQGLPYMVLPYLRKGSLDEKLAKGPLPWQEVLVIGVKVAGALESAHRAGVLHRDIKPANILMSDFGEPQLGDFGIARVADQAKISRTGIVTSTPAHAPPEVLTGRPPGPASDVYSLASTLFTLLAGREAFTNDNDESIFALLNRVAHDPVPDLRPRGIPDAVCDVIERAMAKDPEVRPPTAVALAGELQGAQRRLGAPVTPLPLADVDAEGVDLAVDEAIIPTVAAAEAPSASQSAPVATPLSPPSPPRPAYPPPPAASQPRPAAYPPPPTGETSAPIRPAAPTDEDDDGSRSTLPPGARLPAPPVPAPTPPAPVAGPGHGPPPQPPPQPFPQPPPQPPTGAQGGGGPGGRKAGAIAAIVIAALLVAGGGGYALLASSDGGGGGDVTTTTTDSTVSRGGGQDDDEPGTTETTTKGTLLPRRPRQVTPVGVSATSTAPPGVDSSGTTVAYDAPLVADRDPTTAWRTPGDGAGQSVTLQFAEPVQLAVVGLIPGYAKVDEADGTDRFTENRRVLRVRWVLEDGTAFEQSFDEEPEVQSANVPSTAAATRSLRIEILATTAPGTRDFTAISEVVVGAV